MDAGRTHLRCRFEGAAWGVPTLLEGVTSGIEVRVMVKGKGAITDLVVGERHIRKLDAADSADPTELGWATRDSSWCGSSRNSRGPRCWNIVPSATSRVPATKAQGPRTIPELRELRAGVLPGTSDLVGTMRDGELRDGFVP